MDDGKAFRGTETMTLNNLAPRRDILILKRIDPIIRDQVVQVYFDSHPVGVWKLNGTDTPNNWHESVFRIPAKFITKSDGVLLFSFMESKVDINSFYYWFYQ